LPLTSRDRAFVCPAGHSFDIARIGYINLLQPQDRRSTHAGDAKAAVDARAALERAGVGRALNEAIAKTVADLAPPASGRVVDLGSGTGATLGRISSDSTVAGIGIDLSVAAADAAARRFPSLVWVVANADRRLPLLDSSVDVVLSVHGRRNPAECARVLTPIGHLVVVIPAADDLVELRAMVQGERVKRDRVEAMLIEHQGHFELQKRFPVRERLALERDALLNLLRGTYRGARIRSTEKVAALERMEVTLGSVVCVLKKVEAGL
jgi:23S rRNA (guanine745-N1)-methyltransferase